MEKSNTKIDMIQTGKVLRRYAEENNYRVKDIQEYLGLACPQPIYRWYQGKNIPSIDHLCRLSQLYKVHIEDLIRVEDDEEKIYVDIIFKDSITLRKRCEAYFLYKKEMILV